MQVLSISTGHPDNHYNQEQLLQAFMELWGQKHFNPRRVEQLHRSVQVSERYLALPMEEYKKISSFTESNDHFIRVATDVGEKIIRNALEKAHLAPQYIDAIFFVSVTGLATPSIDAKLCNRLGFRNDIKRIPIFGLGCVAGAAGLARMHDYLVAYPSHKAILLSVELCSLTLQPQDLSVANLIASGLFGDGGACVLATGHTDAKPPHHPSVIASQSRFYPNTEDVMGWHIGEKGFTVILQATVPDLARAHLRNDVDGFLAKHGISRTDIQHWVCHTGGPKVLQAFEEALDLPSTALALSWKSLQSVGNLSSSSVLYVLQDTIEETKPQKGDLGVLLAMGPGFCCEMVLLQW